MAIKSNSAVSCEVITNAYTGLCQAAVVQPKKLVDENGSLMQEDIYCPFCLNAGTTDDDGEHPLMSFSFGAHTLSCPVCDQEYSVEAVITETLELVMNQMEHLTGLALLLPALRVADTTETKA